MQELPLFVSLSFTAKASLKKNYYFDLLNGNGVGCNILKIS